MDYLADGYLDVVPRVKLKDNTPAPPTITPATVSTSLSVASDRGVHDATPVVYTNLPTPAPSNQPTFVPWCAPFQSPAPSVFVADMLDMSSHVAHEHAAEFVHYFQTDKPPDDSTIPTGERGVTLLGFQPTPIKSPIREPSWISFVFGMHMPQPSG